MGGHVPRGISGTGHHTQHVDGHDAVEVAQAVVEESAVRGARNSGIVDHDVQSAEFLDGCGYQRLDLSRLGDVRPPKQRARTQRCRKGFAVVLVELGRGTEDDPRTLGDKPLHRASPDSGRTGSDDGDFAGQFIDHTTS